MYIGYVPYVYVVFLIIFCVFGVVGNVFVFILILVSKEYKKSTTHLYILQLAVADFFFLGFIPFSVIDELEGGNWRFGNGLCKATRGIRYINFYASVMFMTVMSVCYGLIVITFRRKSLRTGSQNGRQSGIGDQQRLTLVCIIFIATFFCCWLTDHIFLIMGLYQEDFDGHLFLARTAMTYINSSLNPYLYTFMGPAFQQKWRSIRQHFSRRRINSVQSPIVYW